MRVRWTDDADEELVTLIAYVYPHNRSAALTMYGRARSKVQQLQEFPRIGRVGRMPNTRELVIDHTPYIAVYMIMDDIVWIMHVIHTSRQWPPEDE